MDTTRIPVTVEMARERARAELIAAAECQRSVEGGADRRSRLQAEARAFAARIDTLDQQGAVDARLVAANLGGATTWLSVLSRMIVRVHPWAVGPAKQPAWVLQDGVLYEQF